MNLHSLQEAGYKYEPDDLSEEEWKLLAEFKSALNQYQFEQMKNK